MKADIKILKTTRIKKPSMGFDGLEVELEVDGEFKRECFVDAEEALTVENGEEKFITKIKELHDKTKEEKAEIEASDQQPPKSEKKTEIVKFKNKVVK